MLLEKVEDALKDLNLVIAMQEELNNFTRNEVWSLVERPKQNVIGTIGMVSLKSKVWILGRLMHL